jgi:large conductance mechanosensitive channel
MPALSTKGVEGPAVTKAFSSEVETGSRQENASNQESGARFDFDRNGKGTNLVSDVEEKGLKMLKEFREFAMKGNVVDLAVGVIIGVAFGGIVTSLVGDIIMPIIGAITGGLDFSNYFTGLSKAVTAGNLADAKKQGAVLAWGNFLTLTLNFIIIAFVLFVVIRFMNKLKRRDEVAPAPPKPTRQEELLTEIRDLLKKS